MFKKMKLAVVALLAGSLMSAPAFAVVAQPDTAEALTYITAGVATILAAFGGKYIINGVTYIARKVLGALGGR